MFVWRLCRDVDSPRDCTGLTSLFVADSFEAILHHFPLAVEVISYRKPLRIWSIFLTLPTISTMAENLSQEPGGFLPPSLPSPAPSNYSSSSTASNLPHPRSNPLRSGSAKEDAARRYLEARLLNVSRRYAKKFQPMEEGEDVKGYISMSEVAKDLGEIIDVVWLSGTRMFCPLLRFHLPSYPVS